MAKQKVSKTSVTVNLFGEGYTLLRYNPSIVSWERLTERAAAMQLTMEQALLDLEFYEVFKAEKINSWKDITSFVSRGTLVHRLSFLEIRSEGKKRKSSTLEELFLANTLFPVCDFTVKVADEKLNERDDFFILEKEVGKIDTFYLDGTASDIPDLRFELKEHHIGDKTLLLLDALYCRDKALVSKGSDSVVSNMRVFLP